MKIKKIIFSFLISALLFLVFFNVFLSWQEIKAKNSLSNQSNKGREDLVPSPTPVFSSVFFPTFFPTVIPTFIPSPTPYLKEGIKENQFEKLNQKFGPCRYIPILMYHHIMGARQAEAIGATNLNVPPEIFREQMNYLLQKGYQTLSLEEMYEGLKNNALPAKPIVLTFDDGYRDFYDNIYPILREKNLKATVFIISQFVDGDRYLSWSQIQEMVESGLVSVGNHTLNHPYLPSLKIEEVRNQIISANNIISEKVGQRVKFLAYPYGAVNSLVEEVLKEGDFLGAVVTANSSPQCLGLPFRFSRIRIGAASLSRYGL